MKSFATLTALAGLASSALAAPLQKRQVINANGTAAFPVGDVNVLNLSVSAENQCTYAHILTRYSNQDFVNNNFTAADRATFLQIIAQEQMHIAALQAQVKMNGGQVIQPCNYSYGNAPTLKALLNATDAVNGLGPSAYIGAGGFLQSKLLLTAGAAIGNIETRHNSWLNGLLGRSEQPNAFQTPLSPTQAYGVASQFIINGTCPPSNANLQGAILAYPPSLNITNQGYPAAPLNAGSTLFLRAVGNVTAPRAAFVYGLNTTIVSFNASSGTTTIPSDVSGQAYVVLTTASQGQALNEQNSVTAPQAFYVDAPAQGFANYQVTTYDFLPGPGRK